MRTVPLKLSLWLSLRLLPGTMRKVLPENAFGEEERTRGWRGSLGRNMLVVPAGREPKFVNSCSC